MNASFVASSSLPKTSVPETMQAALFYAPRDVRLEQVPCPLPGPGELLLRVKQALTCGTDLKCYRRGHPVLLASLPSPFGHECAGEVAALGAGVTDFTVGDRVVVANSAPCGTCYFCEKNSPNLCENLQLLNGTYAEYLLVPAPVVARNTVKLSAKLPFAVAAFTEPLAVSLRGVALCGLKTGDAVAIVGLGPIGQLMVKAAKLKGAHVTAIARNPMKLAMAQDFGGADQVVSIAEGFDPDSIKSRYSPKGYGFDVVIEGVGLPETWEKAVALARRGGLVNWFAGCASGTEISLPTRRVHYDELRFISPFHHTPEFIREALALLESGTIDPRPLLTDTLPLKDLVMAFQLMESGKALKLAITP